MQNEHTGKNIDWNKWPKRGNWKTEIIKYRIKFVVRIHQFTEHVKEHLWYLKSMWGKKRR